MSDVGRAGPPFTLEKVAEFGGQRSRGKLVFTLLLRTDDFSGIKGVKQGGTQKDWGGFGVQGGGLCSPAELPSPGLVGVKETFAEMQSVEHRAFQLHPAPRILPGTPQLPGD